MTKKARDDTLRWEDEKMEVFEITLKLFLVQKISYEELQTKLGSFFDYVLCKNETFLKKHKEAAYADYVFSGLTPLESDKIYKKDQIYTVMVRTIHLEVAQYFQEVVVHAHNAYFKGLTSQIKKIPQNKIIEKIYTLTPAVLKNTEGYWRKLFSLDEFERRLNENAKKKYEYFTGETMREFQLCTSLEFMNRKPISIEYKKIHLIGDKLTLHIAEDEMAQKAAYLLLGVGLLENNSRGMGFVNYRWL